MNKHKYPAEILKKMPPEKLQALLSDYKDKALACIEKEIKGVESYIEGSFDFDAGKGIRAVTDATTLYDKIEGLSTFNYRIREIGEYYEETYDDLKELSKRIDQIDDLLDLEEIPDDDLDDIEYIFERIDYIDKVYE